MISGPPHGCDLIRRMARIEHMAEKLSRSQKLRAVEEYLEWLLRRHLIWPLR